MPLETEYKHLSDSLEQVYVVDVDEPENKILVYEIDKEKETIKFYPKDSFVVKEVLLDGFKKIPPEFSDLGYIKAGLTYYLDKKLKNVEISKLCISKTKRSFFRKYKEKYTVVISYNDFKLLKDRLTQLNNESKAEKSLAVDEFFHTSFPRKFPKQELSARRRATKAISNLDESVIEQLTHNDISKLLDFVGLLLDKKYTLAAHRRKLFNSAKIKVDEVALSDVISKFEILLKEDPPESKWGDFLEDNLYLVESKYIQILPELNVVLAGARKLDFGLIDTQGYLDIFEIKKSSTKILAANQDRGNFYWHTEALKALVQAEKYLYNAERKASGLAEDIAREKNVSVNVVKPRAIVVMGNSAQLDNDAKKEDFRILRMSLKNIEVVLYDELLERLKNQKNKTLL